MRILPSGYKELEYIESAGTQYIDSGVKASSNIRITATFETVNTKNTIIFGSRNSSNNKYLYILLHSGSTDNWRDDFGSEKTEISQSDVGNKGIICVDKNKNTTRINGYKVFHQSSSFKSDFNIYIFAGNTGGKAEQFTSVKMFSFKIYDGDAIIRDFIPCKDSSGNVGFFDIVNNIFYDNKGSGSFKEGGERESIYIYTGENITTRLLTAGKYCDKNIVVVST